MIDRPKFLGPELCAIEAHKVVEMLKRGEVSSSELLDVATLRISQTGPLINATPTICEDRARQGAANLNFKNSDRPGWLAGLPITIKDLQKVKDVICTFGTKGYSNFIPTESDPMVERLEGCGGVVLGKTNTPELGAGGNTFNEVFGPTFNPWNTTLNAGGSSGGAAASLAAGEIWLSHGSDHGGSLRTPAAYCGVVGLRPSPGVACGPGTDNAFMIEPTQGPMARSVTDCALFLDAMSGFDPRIAISYPAPYTPYQEAVKRADGKLKIAFSPDLGGFGQIDTEMKQHLSDVMYQLEKNGTRVELTSPDLSKLEHTYHTLRGLIWAADAKRMSHDIQQHFKKTLADNMTFGLALTLDDIVEAYLNRSMIFNAMIELFNTYDVLACPTVGCMPHLQSEEWVRVVGGIELPGYMDWLRFAFLATTVGLPAISVPVGLGPRGLPVGLQLIGKPRGEAALLAAARYVEMAVGGPWGPIDPVTY